MLFDIYVICFLFIVGVFAGFVMVVIGLKSPLTTKEYFNACDNCNHPYKWYEMFPILSYFINCGRCRYCQKELSLFYPFLELLSGLLFSFSYMLYGFSYEMLVMMILTLLSVMIYVSDFKYYIILDKPVFLAGILILVCKLLIFGLETFIISLCSGFLIFFFMYFIKFIGDKLFKQESLGGGDVKLSTFFGFLLGIRLSIVALIIGSFLAFPCALYSSLTNKNREIPFGPFLITGLYISFIFMEPIKDFISIIF